MAKGGFRGMPGGMNQAAMMKQAQKMQQDFLKMQQELESTRFEFTSGGGAVKAVILGTRQLESIEALDDDWQSFLCGLMDSEGSGPSEEELSAKVGAIARELAEIDDAE